MFDKELIESYYRVAADLERYGQEMLATAERLAKMADGMSETNVRDRSPVTQKASYAIDPYRNPLPDLQPDPPKQHGEKPGG